MYQLMFPSGQFGWQPQSIRLNFTGERAEPNALDAEPVLNDIIIDSDDIDDRNAIGEQQIKSKYKHKTQ